MIERKGLVLYFENKDVLNKLDKRFLNIYYISEKNNYAIIYCDANRFKHYMEELPKIEGVTEVIDNLSGVENNSF